jgi:hypothetical protein
VLPQVRARLGVEAGRRLVEEQHPRGGDQAEGDVDPSALPTESFIVGRSTSSPRSSASISSSARRRLSAPRSP